MSDFETDLLENNLEKNTETSDNFSDYLESDLVLEVSDEMKENDSKILITSECSEKSQNTENVSNNIQTDTIAPDVNCLYLTVKKDYSLSIVKNKIKRAIKSSWKIAVSIFVLNFLTSFL